MAARIPSATYRLQLSRDFGFEAVRRRLPYLDRLGVDTVYLSPVLAARRGSRHGYDGIDPTRLDPERGGARGFHRLARSARRLGIGLLLDIVPNHLAASLESPAWRDLLENGERSRYARLFDVDWDRTPDGGRAVVLPWLDRSVERAFGQGQLAFERRRGRLYLRYAAMSLPVPPRAARRVAAWTGAGPRGRRTRDGLAAINRGRAPVDRTRREALLRDLNFRLVPWWEVESVNYRRFCDISDLAGVRSETPRGFDYTHRWIVAAARRGLLAGLRVDHVDGLADPGRYLRRLARATRRPGPGAARPYLLVEKILAKGESLPSSWPVDGTTGYDALRCITGVLVSAGSVADISRAYRSVVRKGPKEFARVAYDAKREVADQLFPGERVGLARRWHAHGPGDRSRGERAALVPALSSLAAALPVYRTYLGTSGARSSDHALLRGAISEALRRDGSGRRRAGLRLLGRNWSRTRAGSRPQSRFLEGWQQWTGAVAAKGVEDTAFYRFPRFLAAAEVGSDPASPAVSLEEFHTFMARRRERYPHALTATSTHDTKWGEDARARLIALAEWIGPWARDVRAWRRTLLAPTIDPVDDWRLFQSWVATAPSSGRLPASFRCRLAAYLVKAAREAKVRTSWTSPDPAYESHLVERVRELCQDEAAHTFRSRMREWVTTIDHFGRYYSLGQVVLRSTLPGVPDLYQGSEAWNHAFVDPDNRRAISFERFERWVPRPPSREAPAGNPAVRGVSARELRSERGKVLVTAALLAFRREHRSLFDSGEYLALHETGAERPAPVLAYARRAGEEWVVVVVGRELARVCGHRVLPPTGLRWQGRRLRLPGGAPRTWTNLITQDRVTSRSTPRTATLALADLLDRAPWAVVYGRVASASGSGDTRATSSARARRPRPRPVVGAEPRAGR